jgi:hypothetical protein
MSGYQYIATPYTVSIDLQELGRLQVSPEAYEESVLEQRVKFAARACRRMLLRGGFPFSPIVHGHFIERLGGGVVPYETWMKHSFEMLRKAQAFYILTLDGWKESKGVQAEKEYALGHGIPVGYLNAQEWCKED